MIIRNDTTIKTTTILPSRPQRLTFLLQQAVLQMFLTIC